MKDISVYIITLIVGLIATVYNLLISIFPGVSLAFAFATLMLALGSWIFLFHPKKGGILAILLSTGLITGHLISLIKSFMFLDLAIIMFSLLIIFLHLMRFAVPEAELPISTRRILILPPFFLLGMAGLIVLYMI